MRPAEHSTRGIACAGNWILDVVHDITHWPAKSDLVCISGQTSGLGGGAANVSADLAALDGGYPVYAIGLVGDDQLGDTVRTKLAEAGLSGGRIATLSGGVTAHTHVMNVPGDSRTFFYHAGANDRFCAAYVDLHGLATAGCRVFYLGYLNLLPSLDAIGADGRTGAYHLLTQASAAGMEICVDLVSTDTPEYRAVVMATLPAIDVLFLNEVEATRATELSIAGPSDKEGLIAAARVLLDGGVRRAVVIHTPDLALWVPAGETVEDVVACTIEKRPPEQIVSPVGAGDAFAAGVLHAIHEEFSAADALRLGCAVAAMSLGGATATDGIPRLETLGAYLPATEPSGVKTTN